MTSYTLPSGVYAISDFCYLAYKGTDTFNKLAAKRQGIIKLNGETCPLPALVLGTGGDGCFRDLMNPKNCWGVDGGNISLIPVEAMASQLEDKYGKPVFFYSSESPITVIRGKGYIHIIGSQYDIKIGGLWV